MNAEQLQERFANLPEITEPAPPHTWPRHQLSFRRHVAQDDPNYFLSWSTMHATMFVGSGAAFTSEEVEALTPRYLNILREPRFGMPHLMKVGDNTVTSGNLIHQAYHLMIFEQYTGVQVDKLRSIVEFGGGYGAMVLLCRRLGFRGRYTIIDLPELSLLQEFYLSNTIGLHNVILIDNYDCETLSADLLLAIYSISEVPVMLRWCILENIKARYRFFAHQDLYTLPDEGQIDNVEEMGKVAEVYNLVQFPNKFMPGHWYLCDAKNST